MNAVRVATFNIRHGLGLDGRIDLERTAATLRALKASAIGLQEVDQGLPRSGHVDQPAELAALTGLRVAFFTTVARGGGRYGLAVASTHAVESHLEALPRVADEEPRAAIVSRAGGMWLVSTHLSARPEARAVQTRALGELVRGLEGPVVVVGDLNQTRRRLGPLVEAGLGPGPDRHATKPGRWRRKQIDFVLGGRGVRVVRSWTVPSIASDHLPVVAEIEGRSLAP